MNPPERINFYEESKTMNFIRCAIINLFFYLPILILFLLAKLIYECMYKNVFQGYQVLYFIPLVLSIIFFILLVTSSKRVFAKQIFFIEWNFLEYFSLNLTIFCGLNTIVFFVAIVYYLFLYLMETKFQKFGPNSKQSLFLNFAFFSPLLCIYSAVTMFVMFRFYGAIQLLLIRVERKMEARQFDEFSVMERDSSREDLNRPRIFGDEGKSQENTEEISFKRQPSRLRRNQKVIYSVRQ